MNRMELVQNSECVLCEEKTSILPAKKLKPFLKYIDATFFDKNPEGIKQFQEAVSKSGICVLCIHKVMLSKKLKRLHQVKTRKAENPSNKTRTSCLLCKENMPYLVATDDIPDVILENIDKFMKPNLFWKSCKGCAICFNCYFSINIWHNISTSLQKKIAAASKKKKAKEVEILTIDEEDENENDKENFTPSKLSTKKKIKNTRTKPKTSNRIKQVSLYKTLKVQLKGLKPVRQLPPQYKWPQQIVNDQKMFSEVPYVLLLKNNKQTNSNGMRTRQSRKTSSVIETIELSDDETTNDKHTCNVCDKTFISLLEYRMHALWHEKPESVKINLIKNVLPFNINVAEYYRRYKVEIKNKEHSDVDEIAEKYIDMAFSDDESTTNKVNNIIENLDIWSKDGFTNNERTSSDNQTVNKQDSNVNDSVVENDKDGVEVESEEQFNNKKDNDNEKNGVDEKDDDEDAKDKDDSDIEKDDKVNKNEKKANSQQGDAINGGLNESNNEVSETRSSIEKIVAELHGAREMQQKLLTTNTIDKNGDISDDNHDQHEKNSEYNDDVNQILNLTQKRRRSPCNTHESDESSDIELNCKTKKVRFSTTTTEIPLPVKEPNKHSDNFNENSESVIQTLSDNENEKETTK